MSQKVIEAVKGFLETLKTNVYIDFPELTHHELETLMNLEERMVIKGGELVGSGYHVPTKTRDWHIEVEADP